MPRKAYQADLKNAGKGVDLPGITQVRSGDDDGEFRIKITPEAGSPFEISALIPGKSGTELVPLRFKYLCRTLFQI